MKKTYIILSLVVAALIGIGGQFATTNAQSAQRPRLLDGSEKHLTSWSMVEAIRTDNNDLTIALESEEVNSDVVVVPVLRTSDGFVSATASSKRDGTWQLSYSDVADLQGPLAIVFPVINVMIEGEESQALSSGRVEAPGRDAFSITDTETDHDAGVIRIKYTPIDKTFKSIAFAELRLGSTSVPAEAISVVFASDWSVKRGTIVFPVSAEQLLSEPDVQLRVTGYQEIVSDEIVVKNGN